MGKFNLSQSEFEENLCHLIQFVAETVYLKLFEYYLFVLFGVKACDPSTSKGHAIYYYSLRSCMWSIFFI